MQGAVIFLAEGHPAAGCSDDGQLRLEVRFGGDCVLEGGDHHPGGPVKPLRPPPTMFPAEALVWNLSRRPASAIFDRKAAHLADAIPAGAESFHCFRQAKAKRTHNARRYYRDACLPTAPFCLL